MANIPLTPGERYSFAVLVNQATIVDSTDSAQAPYNINNQLIVKDTSTFGPAIQITGSSGTGTSTINNPRLNFKNSTYANDLHIGHGRSTTTTATIIGLRTIGNFGAHWTIAPEATNVGEPYIIMSSSANGNDRRVGIIAGLHTSFRTANSTFTVSDSDYFIEHTAIVNQIVTLPSAVGKEAGRQLVISKLNTGGTLTVSASGADRIVFAGTATPGRRTTQQYAFAHYYCNGNGNWYANETGTWAG